MLKTFAEEFGTFAYNGTKNAGMEPKKGIVYFDISSESSFHEDIAHAFSLNEDVLHYKMSHKEGAGTTIIVVHFFYQLIYGHVL